MINKSNSSDRRRILTFPVVHPCQSISPTTLLSSLISLSHQICDFQFKIFVTQRKNARETIRYVRNLLIFLEEIRDNKSVLPDSIKLCFFELHLTFQKILYLLEDCTREGSRSWILMKFKRVSTEFRILIRTVSTALDVLPLGLIESSTEVREILGLVAKQAEKAKFEVELDDERMAVIVISILNQFENRVVPDPMDLKRVLDYLEIRNWNQCNKEIKFLEEEIIVGRSNGEDREVDFLRNLMAFMIYSRAVVFDYFVDENNRTGTEISRLDDQSNFGEMMRCLNPDDFLCPISLEIMTDPVIISTGHTFDRVSIQKWFKSGNLICPKTGEKLSSTELVPNSVLRKLIRQYCSNNGIPIAPEPVYNRNRDDVKRTRTEPTSNCGAAEEAMKMVSKFLACNLATGSGLDKNKSAYEIRLLAKSNIFNMSCLAESGTIPYLLNLLCSMSPSTQENAMAALLNLSKHQKESKIKRSIVENGGLVLILDVLTEGLKIDTRKTAAATLFHLSSIEEHRKLIGEIPEAIPALVKLLRENSLNSSGKKSVVVAILGLLWFPGNHKKVLAAGTVKVLVDLLNSDSENSEFISESLAVLAILAEKPEGTFAILRTSSAVHRLVDLLESSTISPPAKEYCVSVLLSLCTNGGSEVVAILRKSTSLMNSLYSLLTEGTSRAGKKASSILRLLHEFSDPSSSSNRSLTPAALRQDHRFVHVQ
ncbi:Armadillo [Macleaya cordata]|uniref:RING-type E3 ubiquitin transferase n=1 Tax=Macleaya cordata TaxID=56857 RepID=A0A200PZU9_MACCD|nr:Armadillo [Macleaya cordata]